MKKKLVSAAYFLKQHCYSNFKVLGIQVYMYKLLLVGRKMNSNKFL